MKYKIAICDDSDADREYVLNMVNRWAAGAGQVVHTDTFTSAENFLFHYAEESDYDILLLDIEMGDMDGVTMAKQLRKNNDIVQIVFITGYSDYISEGYEVAALHYLMKPVKEEKLCSVLDRAAEKLQKNETVLNFEIGGEMLRLPIYQIRYADVFGNYVTIHALSDTTVKMTLGELEKQLDERFYRVGRSAIINLTQISRVTKSEIMLVDGTAIPLPRGAYDELIETHYREVVNMYRQIRGWRHDYRNHIQTMKAYAATENWEAIKNYLDLLDEDLTTVDTVIKTGNPMTDAILNSKISLAKSKGIAVVADAHIPVKLKSSEIDLCCIIGNLFDNAIEASVKLPEEQRLIRVYMDMKSTQLYISFTNFTADKKLKKEGRLFRSTKGEGHGFGLVRIDAIVERLDGYISRNSEDGAFTTEILLPQV